MADDDAARRALQRVSDAEREKVAERIRAAAADGRLGLDETRFSGVDVKVPAPPADPRAVVRVGGTVSMGSVSVRRPGWRRRRQLRKALRARPGA